jgi:predicted ATPase
MSHPFGDLVSQHLHRKHGLSQSKLAEGILQAPTIISGMCKGRRLTGPQARERVVAIIQWLHQQSALTTLAEANALLNAAGMAGLQTNQPAEATLLRLLPNSPVSEENRVASAHTGSMDSRRTMTNAFLKAPLGQPSAVPESQIQSLPAKEPKSKTSHHNLPVQLTPFVGRTSEMSKVATLLADPAVRLLTLLGPGGIGKTRLALEVATRQLDHFTDGVYFVSLASVDSGYSLIPLIANALGFSFHSDASPHRQLGDYLQEKNVLLVLDNCEHLIDTTVSPHPAAVTAAMPSFLLLLELLQAAPKLKILLTSRAHINVQGEQLYALDGIDFPQADLPTLPVALQSSAVTLFVQSARMAQPDFQLTEQNVAAVVQICQLVQGLPLAILLAAAWLPMLTPAEILAELRKSQATTPSLDFLAADLHDMPARHRSLRAVFDHSWRLLTAEEQTIFAQLAVFRSGFTLQAAEEILDFRFWRLPAQALNSAPSTPTIQNQKPKIQHILRALLNKSLIRRRPDQQEQGRYDLHELVRQYAAERLAQMADQGEGVRERHSRFYCELLGAQEAQMHGAERKVALAAIELDLGNIHTAWRWALEHPQVAHLSRAVRYLGYFYEARHRCSGLCRPWVGQSGCDA